MSVILAGADNPTWRQMLVAVKAPAVAFDAAGILRRKGEVYDIAEKVAGDTEVWVDGSVKDGDLESAEAFWEVVAHNVERVTTVIEYGGVDFDTRERLRLSQPPAVRAKTIPLWQPHDGLEALEHLAASCNTIAIPRAAMRNRRGPGARIAGLRMQGARIVLTGAGLGDVGSDIADVLITAAWTVPRRYGEAVVASGEKLVRVPAADATYGAYELTQADISGDGWRDDLDLLCRLAAVTVMRATHEPLRPSAAHLPVATGEAALDTPRRPTSVLPLIRRDATPFPVTNGSRALMVCNSCVLSTRCPEATPDAECAYEIPAQLRTQEDVQTMMNTLLEVQAKRALFGAFAEQIQGGERDEGVGQEIDRWMRMVKTIREINDDSSYVDLRVRQRGTGNPLAAIFGGEVSEQMAELDEPIDAAPAINAIASN